MSPPAALVFLALVACGPAAGPPPLVLKDVTVIDIVGAGPRQGMTVVVRNGEVQVPAGAETVDARGKFLVPGLWDMHVHLWDAERQMPLFLANGVTGVRDMASRPEVVFRLREEVRTGKVAGPRIVACGPQVDGPGQTPGHAIPVANAAEARQAVQRLKALGADCVKPHDRVPLV